MDKVLAMRTALAVVALLALAACGGSAATAGTPGSASAPSSASAVTSPAGTTGAGIPRLPQTAEIDHGRRTRRWVALTFDADMTRAMLARLRSGQHRTWYDAAIVHELEATHTPATIFLTGLWTEAYPNVVRRLAHNKLFELENHSVDHSGWLAPCYGLPVVHGALSKRAEIEGAAADIRSVAGITPRYFRFPGGCHNESDLRLVAAAGERAVGWDVVSGDAYQPDPLPIIQQVLDGVRPGSIVIMHIVGAPNAPATDRVLPVVIRGLRARGYRFVTVRKMVEGR
jgi:peptidoglycan/xylan/chitin deacetylase (PgdA/CDA1 family)